LRADEPLSDCGASGPDERLLVGCATFANDRYGRSARLRQSVSADRRRQLRDETVQLHRGSPADDHGVEPSSRDARIARAYEGTAEVRGDAIARELLDERFGKPIVI